jgi:acyl carrier protein
MKEQVYKIVAQVMNVPMSTVNDDSSPDTVPAWDSLKHMNLVLALEQEFEIQFNDAQTVEMLSVGLILAIISEALCEAH